MELGFDGFALSQGVFAEDLAAVTSRDDDPVRRQESPRIRLSLLERLFRDRPRRLWIDESIVERRVLVEHGWTTVDGVLTMIGREINADLGNPIRVASLYRVGVDHRSTGALIIGATWALAHVIHQASDPPDGGDDPSNPLVRFQLMPANAVPLYLARWGRLGPAWSFPTDHEPLPAGRVLDRLEDASEPVPEPADDALRAMWSEPWMQWGVGTHDRALDLQYIHAGARGQFVCVFEDDNRVRLVARPSTLVWGDLVRVIAGDDRRSAEGDGW